jgi:hypothetical protein
MIMLVGIVKKNAIMMIDFALEREREHGSAREAITEALLIRFRPIMMTTMAALMGSLPIALGWGRAARPPAARSCGRRRPHLSRSAHALHHAGALRLSRPLRRQARSRHEPQRLRTAE